MKNNKIRLAFGYVHTLTRRHIFTILIKNGKSGYVSHLQHDDHFTFPSVIVWLLWLLWFILLPIIVSWENHTYTHMSTHKYTKNTTKVYSIQRVRERQQNYEWNSNIYIEIRNRSRRATLCKYILFEIYQVN